MPGFEPRILSANDKRAKPLDHAAALVLPKVTFAEKSKTVEIVEAE
jgi:hypothetical protein